MVAAGAAARAPRRAPPARAGAAARGRRRGRRRAACRGAARPDAAAEAGQRQRDGHGDTRAWRDERDERDERARPATPTADIAAAVAGEGTRDAVAGRAARPAAAGAPASAPLEAAAAPPAGALGGVGQTLRDALAGAMLASLAINAWAQARSKETAEEQTRRAIRDARERAALAEAAAVVPRGDILYSRGTAAEPVQWVNMWVKKVWRIYQNSFERFLVRVLQPPIDNLKKPGYIKRVVISEFTLGNDPVVFSNMKRRTSRQMNDFQYEVDCRYSGNARALLSVELGTPGNSETSITVPVLLYNLDFDGELWVQLRMGPLRPWVDTVSVSFASLPNIRFELAPFRQVRLMDIPVLNSFLEQLLMRDLPSLILYPRRIDFTLAPEVAAASAAAAEAAAAAAGDELDSMEGPACDIAPVAPTYKGELVVTLVEARGLPAVGVGALSSDPFCMLSLGTQLSESRTSKQTALKAGRGAPAWEQEFVFLVEDPQRQRLLVQCRDSYLTLRPFLGFCQLPIADLEPGSPVDVWLPLAYDNAQVTKGEIRLIATYSSFTDRPRPRAPSVAAANAARVASQQVASEGAEGASALPYDDEVASDLAAIAMPEEARVGDAYEGAEGLVAGWLEDVDGARDLLQPTDSGAWRGGDVEMMAAMPRVEETLPLLEQWWSGLAEKKKGDARNGEAPGWRAGDNSGDDNRSGAGGASAAGASMANVGGFDSRQLQEKDDTEMFDQDAAIEEALALEALVSTSLKQAAKREDLDERISSAPISDWSDMWQDALEGDVETRKGRDAPRSWWRRVIRTARGLAVGTAVGAVIITLTAVAFKSITLDQEELQRRAFELWALEEGPRELVDTSKPLEERKDSRRMLAVKETEIGRALREERGADEPRAPRGLW